MAPRNHAACVASYCDAILSGEIIAGRYVELAVRRYLDDIEHAHKRGLHFDAEIAEKSNFLWARQMGYDGKKLSSPSSTDGRVEAFSYLDGDVIHLKVPGTGHGATHQVGEETLLRFLQGRAVSPKE